MSFFDFLKRPEAPSQSVVVHRVGAPDSDAAQAETTGSAAAAADAIEPQVLRQELAQAIRSGDLDKLTCLCQRHEKSIFERGMIWMRIPSGIRSNPKVLRWYGQGVGLMARACARQLNKPELLERVRQIEKRLSTPRPPGTIAARAAQTKAAAQPKPPVVKIMAAIRQQEAIVATQEAAVRESA